MGRVDFEIASSHNLTPLTRRPIISSCRAEQLSFRIICARRYEYPDGSPLVFWDAAVVGSTLGKRAFAVSAVLTLAVATVLAARMDSFTPLTVDAGPDVLVDVGDLVEFRGQVTGVDPLRAFWFLGNGDSTAGGLPVFVRRTEADFRYSQEGVYETILHVYDGLGRRAVDTRVVTVKNLRPTAVIATDKTILDGTIVVEEDEIVRFDGGSSLDTPNDLATLSYEWDFGDGSDVAFGPVREHAFARSGTYLVTLTVRDGKTAIDMDRILVDVRNVAPRAGFVLPPEVFEDQPFTAFSQGTFDTSSDLATLRYLWSFGDGSSSTAPSPVHAYGRSGTYVLSLTVTDDEGESDSVSAEVRVLNAPPRAVLNGPTAVPEGSTGLFDASATMDNATDLSLLNFTWDFDGDGRSDAFGSEATNLRSDDTTYVASVEARDDDRATDLAFQVITVSNVAPEVSIVGAFVVADFAFTISGERWHDVTLTVFEGSRIIGQTAAFRLPGSPKEQTVFLNDVRLNIAEVITARFEYTPSDDPVNGNVSGDNPGFLNLTFEDGDVDSFFHNFNAQQTDTWIWELDFSANLVGHPVHLEGWIHDPGADDLVGSWDFGDGAGVGFTSPSDGSFPRRILHEVIHTFPTGTFTVRFTARDDDGASGSDTAVVIQTSGRLTIDNVAPLPRLGGTLTVLEDEATSLVSAARDTASHEPSLSFLWSFGDGATATGASAAHGYALTGTYLATLAVSDPLGETSVDSITIVVLNRPPIAAAFAPGQAVEDEAIVFDATPTEDTPSDRASLRFYWSFSDGLLGTGATFGRTFPVSGEFGYGLSVQDDNGATSTFRGSIRIQDVVPQAILPEDLSALEDIAFLFDASGSSDTPTDLATLRYTWDFGEGAVGAGIRPVHTYAPSGAYRVGLTVTDSEGAEDSVERTLVAADPLPIAHLAPSQLLLYDPTAEFTFEGFGFDTPSDADSLRFAWDFGDGTTGLGTTVTHAFLAFGSFSVTLTVTDHAGGSTSDTTVVNVVLDSDLDGLPDQYEREISETDPFNDDTDADNLLDFFEVFSEDIFEAETNPLAADNDFDGLTDWQEVFGIKGWITNPSVADTDGDGLTDGGELTTIGFKTTQRFAIEGKGDAEASTRSISLANVFTRAPKEVIESVDARIGITHPRSGELRLTISVGSHTQVVRDLEGGDTPNAFDSFNLTDLGLGAAELVTPRTWILTVENFGADRGFLEYFEVHIVVRIDATSPDTDGDGLGDQEEITLGADGWLTDVWTPDTDGDGIEDDLEASGWKKVGGAFIAASDGFRTDPIRADTDRDGFPDGGDLDPLHDLMAQLTIGTYIALDPDPDCDDSIACVGDPRTPEPFVGVVYFGKTFYTPHADPTTSFVTFDKVYTLDVLDDSRFTSLTLQAWDDDIVADKQWDLSPTESLDHAVTFDILAPFDGFPSGAGTDGDEGSCGGLTPDANACRDAFLSFQIVPVRQPRINTVFVDSLDVDDLVATETGDLRYLGDQVFYVAWIEATTPRAPFVVGLNAVIVPRVQFLNSSANHTLRTTTDAGLLPDHLKALTFTAFDDASSETTNAIAGVLQGTLTGDQAFALLDDLTRDQDRAVNGAATVVADALVTLGLADDLVNAIPFGGVRFDATDKGPGDLLGDFVDAFVGAARFVVQGLVLIGTAIAQFFQQAGAFLVELGMAVIGAIQGFLGAVAEAVEKVGEAFESLLVWLVDWAVDLLVSSLGGLVDAMKAALDEAVSGARNAAAAVWNDFQTSGSVSDQSASGFSNSLFSPALLLPLGALSAALVVTAAIVGAALLPLAFLVSAIAILAILAILSAITGGDFSLQAPPLVPPAVSALSPDGLLLAAREYVDQVEAARGMGSHLAEVWNPVAEAFDILATALTFIFLVGNSDPTGVGVLIVGLTFSIWAALISARLFESVPADQRGPVEWIIGVTLVMVAILDIAAVVLGLVRSFIDPTGVKYVGIAAMAFIAAGLAIVFSLRALDILN